MVEKVSKKILRFLEKDSKYNGDKEEILLYGIQRILEDVPKAVGILIIGILLNVLLEVIIVTIIIAMYKTYVGGVHAKTNIGCFIYSVVFYLLIIYVAKYIYVLGSLKTFLIAMDYIFSLYCIWVYVPADVVEMPKVDPKLRNNIKIKSLIVLNILFLSAIFIKNEMIVNLIYTAIFFINIMTTRTIYKMFNNEYGFEAYLGHN